MHASSTRLWIFVIVVLVGMGLCAAVLIATAAGLQIVPGLDLSELVGGRQERVETSFEVGATPTLEVGNISGAIRVEAGTDGTVHVVAIKEAATQSRLEQIKVNWSQQDGRVVIEPDIPSGLRHASVELEITAPAGSSLVADTVSGSLEAVGLSGTITVVTVSGDVDLRDVGGEIQAETTSGAIAVRGAAGRVRLLRTLSGDIDYEGDPRGECHFESTSGRIDMRLPEDLNARIDLGSTSGRVEVDYEVAGTETRHQVHGTIGTGDGVTITAHTVSGRIGLEQQ